MPVARWPIWQSRLKAGWTGVAQAGSKTGARSLTWTSGSSRCIVSRIANLLHHLRNMAYFLQTFLLLTSQAQTGLEKPFEGEDCLASFLSLAKLQHLPLWSGALYELFTLPAEGHEIVSIVATQHSVQLKDLTHLLSQGRRQQDWRQASKFNEVSQYSLFPQLLRLALAGLLPTVAVFSK